MLGNRTVLAGLYGFDSTKNNQLNRTNSFGIWTVPVLSKSAPLCFLWTINLILFLTLPVIYGEHRGNRLRSKTSRNACF